MTDTKTLYFIVLIITLLFANFSQGHPAFFNGKIVRKFNKMSYAISFLVPWYMLSFTNIGVDYQNYYEIINEIDLDNFYLMFYVESGFALLSALLKILFNGNIDAVLFVFKTFSILGAYIAIYILRNRLNVFYSIFAYMFLLFLPSFYLISQAMASAIVLLSLAIYYKTEKSIIPGVLLILGGFIHNSVFIFFPIFILCNYLIRTKLTSSKKLFIIVSYLFVTIAATTIYGYMIQNVSGFHYVNYGGNKTSGSGLYFFVLYIPLFIVAYITNKYEASKNNRVFIFIFILSSAMFRILSYQFRVIERMEFLLLANYIFYLPIFIDNQKYKMHNKMPSYSKMNVIFILYILYIGYGVIEVRTSADVEMSIYRYFNPFAV